jgi:hypothetical protein
MPFNPCRAEFSPSQSWTCKNHIYTRIYRTPWEVGTERIATIQPAKDGCFSFHIVEMNKDLSLVEVIGTSAGRGYGRSLTRVMTFCDRSATTVFKHGREPDVTQTVMAL